MSLWSGNFNNDEFAYAAYIMSWSVSLSMIVDYSWAGTSHIIIVLA